MAASSLARRVGGSLWMHQFADVAMFSWLMLLPSIALGCGLHPQGSEPGCRDNSPSDCEPGWRCRFGVCVREVSRQRTVDAAFGDSKPEVKNDTENGNLSADVHLDAVSGSDVTAE